jgi:hypothetical protein
LAGRVQAFHLLDNLVFDGLGHSETNLGNGVLDVKGAGFALVNSPSLHGLLGFEPALELALDGIRSLNVPSPLACQIGGDFVTERSEPLLERLLGTLLLSHP